jgi:hypothetical protein
VPYLARRTAKWSSSLLLKPNSRKERKPWN